MKDETKQWLNYTNENFIASKVLLKSHLYNPSLQNAQQSIEKYIKACFIQNGLKLQKTHNVSSLTEILKQNKIYLNISDDELELIDTIYLSSKYPLGSVLPDFEPDSKICVNCIEIANQVREDIENYLTKL